MRTRLIVPVVLVGFCVVLLGQSTKPAAAPAAEPLKLHLMDGSLVSGKLSITELVVETQFGTLKVPVESIKSFTPGLSSHPAFDKQLADMINDLGSDSFPDREKSQQALIKLGPPIAPELRLALKSSEGEKQTRLQKIIEEFEALREGDEEADTSEEWSRNDVIVTNSFTIVGHIATNSFSVTNAYGTLQLKLADIRTALRASAEPEEIKKTLAVTGNTINSHTFQAALRINKGDQVTVTATGSIAMTPWGDTSSDPDGSSNFGNIQPGNIPGGALIAKIGTATQFKVGSKHTFTADRSGVLQFGIAMQGNYSNNQFPGEYQVKIRVVRK